MNIKELAPWVAIAITLVLSILIPLFTQIVNNRFQLKLKKYENDNIKEKRRLDAYEDFFKYVGGCVIFAQKENISEAGASIQRLYMYLPEEKWNDLDLMFELIKNGETKNAIPNMESISKWIANDIKQKSIITRK